jgi:hypothetical protein
MKNEKSLDAIEFKRQLQENVMKKYNTKNSKELMDCINKNASKSILYRKSNNLPLHSVIFDGIAGFEVWNINTVTPIDSNHVISWTKNSNGSYTFTGVKESNTHVKYEVVLRKPYGGQVITIIYTFKTISTDYLWIIDNNKFEVEGYWDDSGKFYLQDYNNQLPVYKNDRHTRADAIVEFKNKGYIIQVGEIWLSSGYYKFIFEVMQYNSINFKGHKYQMHNG